MKERYLRGRWITYGLLVGLLLLFLPTVEAQPSPTLANLLVELWPEYDRPEVLVIYRGELQPDTQLPAVLSFRLPGYIEDMHAVAVEQDGNLVDVNPDSIELLSEGNETLFTFTTPSRRIQFEYYDPVILSQDGQTRQLDFRFSSPAEIDMTIFELQEPFGATEFSVTPPPDDSFISADGLKYNNLEVAGLTPGDTFSLTATYQRDSNELSVEALGRDSAVVSGPPLSEPVDLDDAGQDFTLGYLLIGAGLLLLVGTGVYWWWSTQGRTAPEFRSTSSKGRRRPARRQKRRVENKREARQTPARPASSSEETAGFCYRCGAALRPDSNFCHVCGAERRSD
jgi:hypothetical protein